MNTFEYSDFYKFIVSIGVVLIGLAILLPWLLLNTAFDTGLKAEDIAKLSADAQSLVATRQATALWLISHVAWLSGSIGVVGFGFLGTGLALWARRQKVRDEKEASEAAKTKSEAAKVALELEELSSKRKLERVNEAATEQVDSDKVTPEQPDVVGKEPLTPSTRALSQYLEIEETVRNIIKRCFGNDGELLSDRRIGSAEFDQILIASGERSDAIFEVKYASKGFKLNWVRESSRGLALSLQIYANTTGRHAVGVIFFISPNEVLKRTTTAAYQAKVTEELSTLGAPVRLIFIAEEDLSSFECSRLRKMVYPAE